MSKRIDPDTEIAIKQLLYVGKLSQRSIAKVTGINRGTVNSIARGKRKVQPVVPVVPDTESVFRGGPVSRCPCGSFSRINPLAGVCLACQVRRLPGHATPDTEADTLVTDLEDQDQLRYEAMRIKAKKRKLRGNRRLTG